MSNSPPSVRPSQEKFWWQGALMTFKARGQETGRTFSAIEATFPPGGFGPPLHVHHREDESFYVLEGEIRFRCGNEEFSAGPGDFVHGPRGVPHTFKVGERGARALLLIMPSGLEEMFREGGTPAHDMGQPPEQEYRSEQHMEKTQELAAKYGFEVLGPPLG